MSESLVDKWRKIPLGAGAVVAGMCADELAARDAKIRKLIQRCLDQKIYPTECFNGILALLGQPEESTR